MRILPLVLILLVMVPIAYAEPQKPIIAIYSTLPVSGLVDSLNDTYKVVLVENLTQAFDADVIVLIAPVNISHVETMALRRLLEAGGMLVITSEPGNDTVHETISEVLRILGLPSLFYDDVIYDYIHNDGTPNHPVVNGTVLYSCSLVERADAIRKNYTMPSAIALKNESIRDVGRLVRGEEIKALKGYLAAFGGSTMFSDLQYNDTHTRFDVNGRILVNVIEAFLSEQERYKKPLLPLIDEYLLYLAIAIFALAILKTIKAGRP